MKIYGELVSKFKVKNDQGVDIEFFNLKDLNSKTKGSEETIKVQLGKAPVDVGSRVSFTGVENNGIWFATGSVKVYKNKQNSKDNSGTSTGHAINGAALLLSENDPNKDLLIEKAKLVHMVTQELKAEHRKLNPDMPDKELGASVGHAVLNGCKIASKKGQLDYDSIKKFSLIFLNDIAPEVLEFVKAN